MSHLHLWPVDLPVYLHRVPVDFRKQINGLAVLVSESMQMDAFKPGLFVFTNVSARSSPFYSAAIESGKLLSSL